MKCSRKKSFQVFCFPFIGFTFLVLPLLPPASNHPPMRARVHTHTHTHTEVVIFKHQAKNSRNFTYVSQDKF